MNLPLQPSYGQQLNGDLIGKINIFKLIREFVRYSGIDQGYYMEFGIMNGEFAVSAYRQLRGYVTDIYGFDTFAGHPPQTAADANPADFAPYFYEGNYKSMEVADVGNMIANLCMLDHDRVHLVEGEFSKSLPNFEKNQLKDKGFPICINVDCDLYSSSSEVFGFITDIVRTGTWLLVDDFWCYRGDPKLGVRRAFDEWVESNGRVGVSFYENFGGFARAYIVHEL